MKRRTALKHLGLAGAGVGVLPTSVSAGGNNLQKYIRENGHYIVNNRGTDSTVPHGFRSKRPLRKETNQGGVVQVHPKGNGIFAETDLEENDFGGSGFGSEKFLLDDLSKITVTGETFDNRFNVSLWVEDPRYNHNDVIFEWEDEPGHVERRVSLDRDRVLFGPWLPSGEFELGRDTVFKDRGTGTPRTIQGWQDFLGDVTQARVLVGVTGPVSKAATITQFNIEAR